MQSRLEQSLQKDIDTIRSKVIEMSGLIEKALKSTLKLLKEKNKHLAYSIIINDQNVDQIEIEIDRLCQAFLIRHQPAAGILRFIYATIKINNELERVGDYAEGIARHYLTFCDLEPLPTVARIEQIANNAIPMFRKAIKAYKNDDCNLAKKTMKGEDLVDELRYKSHREFIELHKNGNIVSEAMLPLMMIATRYERIADRACNICEEVLYICTGEEAKHEESDTIKILFIDKHDACRAQMATAIGNSLGFDQYQFFSAGTSPTPVDPKTLDLLKDSGFDISKQKSSELSKVVDVENFDILIALSKQAAKAFPPPPSKAIKIIWEIKNPSKLKGKKKDIDDAYKKTFNYIEEHIHSLINAINDQKIIKKEKSK